MKKLMAVIAMLALLSTSALAQKVSGSSATSVSAEVTKGKLNPSESKPGDQVNLKLKDDVKSNGEVVLKKGTTITGVVKNVNRVEGKGGSSTQAQSMMEIEWLAPVQGGGSHQLMLAVQSVTQVSPAYRSSQESDGDWGLGASGATSAGSSVGRSGGGLLGGTLGAATSVGGSAGGAIASTTSVTSQSNAALMSMPSVVAADAGTATSLESNLGMSGGQLFKTGRGELVTAGGSRQSLDIFSHMNNDTVLTSRSKNFEISSGAQMQLLVGVQKN